MVRVHQSQEGSLKIYDGRYAVVARNDKVLANKQDVPLRQQAINDAKQDITDFLGDFAHASRRAKAAILHAHRTALQIGG